jgi:hypothetical protein
VIVTVAVSVSVALELAELLDRPVVLEQSVAGNAVTVGDLGHLALLVLVVAANQLLVEATVVIEPTVLEIVMRHQGCKLHPKLMT